MKARIVNYLTDDVPLPDNTRAIAITAPDGREYTVSLEGNGLRVQADSLTLRPQASNVVVVFQGETAAEPVAFIGGTGWIGTTPDELEQRVRDAEARNEADRKRRGR